MKRVYLCGPMTGIPHFNFPAFRATADTLRYHGYDVVSPAELDDPADQERAMASPDGSPIHYDSGKTWGDFLARDVKLLADDGIEAVVVLPGWEKSRGARLETFVANALCGLPIMSIRYKPWLGDPVLWNVPPLALVRAWAGHDDLYFRSPLREEGRT